MRNRGISRHRLFLGVLVVTALSVMPAASDGLFAVARAAGPSPAAPKKPPPAKHDVIIGRLLAFNDFHGAIDPPTGSAGLVNGVPAGGAEYLAYWVNALRADAQ